MVQAILSAHDEVRRRALPAVSVLVGPPDGGSAAWQAWLGQQGRATAVVNDRNPQAWPLAWIEQVLQGYDLAVRAERYLLRQGHLRPTAGRSWRRNSTGASPSLLVPHFPVDYGLSPAKLGRWLLERQASQQPIDPTSLWERQQAWMQAGERRVGLAFQQMLALLDDASAPALLVVAATSPADAARDDAAREDADSNRHGREFANLLQAAKLAMAAPELTVGVAVEERLWQRFVEQQPPSFSKALLCEHAIRAAAASDEAILPSLRHAFRPAVPQEAFAATLSAGV